MTNRRAWIVATALALALATNARAQPPGGRTGEIVPRDVREMYDRGLQFLAASQSEKGDWTGGGNIAKFSLGPFRFFAGEDRAR